MSNLEDQLRDLREKNSELAKEVQSLKVLAAQKDKEKLELTKEINELRLKISRLRSGGAAKARKLDAGLQAASEEALSHLVQASGAVARTLELTKQYIQEREELDLTSPLWCHVSGNTSAKKVNEVPPLLLGGQSIQPVVSLSRTILNNRSLTRSPNQNSGVTHRAVPMHMLQDVYIPLTRIDPAEFQVNNADQEENNHEENSADNLGLEESMEQSAEIEESQNMTSELDELPGLDAVLEESAETEEEEQTPPPRQINRPIVPIVDNPLEGPSWLLDVVGARENLTRAAARASDHLESASANRVTLEPDSTTPCDTPVDRDTNTTQEQRNNEEAEKENAPLSVSLAFTPTVRRRKRTSSPPRPSFSPRPLRKHSIGRVLKVVVAKMRLSDEDPGGSGDSSPPKRRLHDTPKSPRRSTDGRPGISERRSTIQARAGDSPQLKDKEPTASRPRPGISERRSTIEARAGDSPQLKDKEPTASRPRPGISERRSTIEARAGDSPQLKDKEPTASRPRPGISERRSTIEARAGDSPQLKDKEPTASRPRFDAPSPNGATDAGVIVCEANRSREAHTESHSRPQSRGDSRMDYSDSDHSSTGDNDARTRRTRKQVSYKEKPLNRKLRR